jgi:hypothetical protein
MGIASMVCGIIGIAGVFITNLIIFGTLSYIMVLLAIIFGIVVLKKGKKYKFCGAGIAGFVLGIIGFVPSVIETSIYGGSKLISDLKGSSATVEEVIVTPLVIQSQNPDFSANSNEYTNNLYKSVYNGDIRYIKKYIENFSRYSTEHEETFSNDDLRLLRNTIYAIHGYKFSSGELQEYFQRFAWYNGTKENIENELSENELGLIRVILAMEAANPPTHMESYIRHLISTKENPANNFFKQIIDLL